MAICFFCKSPLSVQREVMSNACERCGEQELARPVKCLKVEERKVVRCWQRTSLEKWAVQASGSVKYRAPEGRFYYVHPDMPRKAFSRRIDAARAALEAGV